MSCKAENGLYFINDEYRILHYNENMKKMYPEIKNGQLCYKAIALRDSKCDICPLNGKESQNSFYNTARREWIQAQAANTEIPGIGECYAIIFSRRLENEQLITEEIKSLNEANNNLRASLEREKVYREQISEALDKAEAANRSKSSFLFNMSHDIRTPMNAILGLIKICSANINDPDKVLYCLSKIEVSSNHLLKLFNEILDMAKIDNGALLIEEQKCDFINFIHGIEDMVRVEMRNRGLNFIVDINGIRDTNLYCDTLHIGQALLNLLSNAMKFNSENGYVWFTVSQEHDEEDDEACAVIKVSVRDNGIGISHEFIKHIFNAFERERSSENSKYDGAGLGLAITKKIIDAVNGKINVKSMPGIGTEFIVTFKLRKIKANADDINGNYTNCFKGKRALLVEDNELNREIAVELLGETGMIIDEAADGKEAVNKVNKSPEGYYDVVLMDVQMTVLNGYEATKIIRSLERSDVIDLPIIAMTANTFVEDVQECLDSGMNDHIAKPIEMSRVIDVLNEYLLD